MRPIISLPRGRSNPIAATASTATEPTARRHYGDSDEISLQKLNSDLTTTTIAMSTAEWAYYLCSCFTDIVLYQSLDKYTGSFIIFDR